MFNTIHSHMDKPIDGQVEGKKIPLEYELMKDVEEPNEESCEQLPECSRKQEGQNKKKNGGSDKKLQKRGIKRKGLEEKGPPQKKKRSPLCPSKQDIDSPSNESK